MPFQKGNTENKKRKSTYSQAKVSLAGALCRGLERQYQEHGDKLLDDIRQKDPATLLRIMAGLIPQQLDITTDTEPMSVEQAMGECVQFMLSLPDEQYQICMQAIQAERLQTVPETPVIEHDSVH